MRVRRASPEGVWSTWQPMAVAAAVTVPFAAVLLLRPEARSPVPMALTGQLTMHGALLTAALVLYVHWRLTSQRGPATLSVALLVVAVLGIAVSTTDLARSPWQGSARSTTVMLVILVLGLTLARVATLTDRRGLRHDPIAVGLTGGLLLSLPLGLVLVRTGLAGGSGLAVIELRTFALAVMLGVAVVVLCQRTMALRARQQVAAAVALMHLSHVAPMLLSDSRGAALLSTVTAWGAATTALVFSLRLLRTALADTHDAVEALRAQVEQFEAGIRVDRKRLHEIGSTIAGIASATQVMRSGASLPTHRRHLLEEMLESEIHRLERLMAARASLEPRPVDIDEVVRSIVVRHRVDGHRVDWTPSTLEAIAISDDLAEVVNILLCNAARHGGGEGTRLTYRVVDGDIEVVVSDHGPGVASDQVTRIFEWGVRSETSPGEGIGLHIARSLMVRMGGSLTLDPQSGRGATFRARVPGSSPPPVASTRHTPATAGSTYAAVR